MSVPDPSTTFLDIGTEIGGTSLYEDDPFNLEHLLPSNFSINQLEMNPSSPDGHSHHGHGMRTHDHHFQNNNNQHILNAHGAEASMAITAKAIMENNNIGHNLSIHSGHSSSSGPHSGPGGGHHSAHQSIGMNMFPETTISPMSGPPGSSGSHFKNMDPMGPMGPLNGVIKTEPVAYIKREDNNNAPPNLMQLHPPHHMLNEGYLHNLHSTTSPMSSMSLPGSPPSGHHSNHEKNQVAMAMASLSSGGAGPRMGPGGHIGMSQSPPNPHGGGGPPHSPQPGQHQGGGKMRTPTPSTSRKKSAANELTPEEEELANIPSLQMRIKILQQRVCHPFFLF